MKEVLLTLLTFLLPMNMAATNPPVMQKSIQIKESKLEQKKECVTIIGDSLTVSITPRLKKFDDKVVYIDGKVGRQVQSLPNVYEKMKDSRKLGETLVIALGTNGSYSVSVIQEVIDDARKNGVEQFYLVNVRMDRSWQDTVNKTHAKLVKDNAADTKLINWYQVSKNAHEYFAEDGVHLSEVGKEAYVNMLKQFI